MQLRIAVVGKEQFINRKTSETSKKAVDRKEIIAYEG